MEKAGSVQSVERALRLLETLASAQGGLRLTDLARAEALAPSTTHRLLTVLEQRDFARFERGSKKWHVGARAFTVGIAFTRWQDFIATAMPFLRRLRDLTRETANLGVLQEGEVVTVAQAESREIMRATAAPGGRTPVMNSGMGKAIVASWPDQAVMELLSRHGLAPLTRNSLREPGAVFAELARVRREGYAFDREEFTPGMRCAAAVVWSASGEAVGAISVSALALRLPEDKLPEMGEVVAAMARELTLAMGGQPPLPMAPAG